MMFRRFVWLIFLAGSFLVAGCAEFLEDYQYNPAGPLYTSDASAH